ncbi:TonB-dependent receptor [Sphingobium sp. Sx8-8]|uniref:TonB-dependent receptor n=1 Tax=Sphingobium sp. Sx8-8 TaxID=2933617 RepID=UPI001F575D3E
MADQEIVVTARKREERLQDVPVSVTAFSADRLAKQNVTTLDGLAASNPNVKISPAAGNPVAFVVTIRGNVQNSNTLPVDASVGVYVDGLIQAHTFGTIGLTTDLANVQTLKGPQGTLFGRNTTGGAMLITTVDPELGKLSGYVQADLGELDTRRFGGAINIPVGDQVAVRLVYQNNERGDYQTFSDGSGLGRKKEYVLRGKILIEPAEGTRVYLSGEKTRELAHSTMDLLTQPNNPRYDDVPLVPKTGASAPGVTPVDPRTNGERALAVNQSYGVRIEHDIAIGNIKLLLGHRAYSIEEANSLPPGLGYTFQDKPDNKDYSAELQFNGSLLDNRLDIAAGLFYFNETIHERQNTFLYSGVQRTSRLLEATTDSKSAYFQATGHLTDNLNLTLGLRYTDDKKTGLLHASTLGTDGPGTEAKALLNPTASLELKKQKVNYLATIDYSPIDNLMFYISHATGYRSGGMGVDRRTGSPTSAFYRTIAGFLPEEIKNYEAGFKSQFLDRQVMLNGAFFYQDYSNYQYSAIDPATIIRTTLNADAHIKGFELESSFRLPADFTLSANAGLTDAKLTSGPSKGSQMIQIPRWTWSVTLEKSFDLAGGNVDLFANYAWRSSFFSVTNDPLAPGDEQGSSTIRSLGLLNLSATWTKGPWKLAVYGDNVTNEHYYNYTVYAAPGTAVNFGGLGVSRVIGGRVKYQF